MLCLLKRSLCLIARIVNPSQHNKTAIGYPQKFFVEGEESRAEYIGYSIRYMLSDQLLVEGKDDALKTEVGNCIRSALSRKRECLDNIRTLVKTWLETWEVKIEEAK